jgi:hypothetical protein
VPNEAQVAHHPFSEIWASLIIQSPSSCKVSLTSFSNQTDNITTHFLASLSKVISQQAGDFYKVASHGKTAGLLGIT